MSIIYVGYTASQVVKLFYLGSYFFSITISLLVCRLTLNAMTFLLVPEILGLFSVQILFNACWRSYSVLGISANLQHTKYYPEYSDLFGSDFLIYFAMTLDSVCVCVCVCVYVLMATLYLSVPGTYLLFFVFETVPCV
jgi:hypothetical protein